MQFEVPTPSYGPETVDEAVEVLRKEVSAPPATAVLTGTGLGDLAAGCDIEAAIDYARIPHFPVSTVPSHAGRLVFGTMGGRPLAVLQGRFHLYEGYASRAVTFPVRVLQALGVRNLILTNASGGLNPAFASGDIMLIADHINLAGDNPLVGPNPSSWGPRFPEMTAAYNSQLRQWALDAASDEGLALQQGVYVGLRGPSLETPAEMRFLRTVGADAVGFSTVMETIAAVHGGMRVLGLSTITNMCLPDRPAAAGVDEIIAVARAAAPRLEAVVSGVLRRISDSDAT